MRAGHRLSFATNADRVCAEVLLKERGDEVNRRAWALDNLGPGKSLICEAWIRYAPTPRTRFWVLAISTPGGRVDQVPEYRSVEILLGQATYPNLVGMKQ